MPRFNITAEFDLTTTVEPDGITFGSVENEADGFEDNSYYQSETITTSGGSLSFVIEADSEEDAYGEAERLISDGHEVTDYNGLNWEVESVNITTEPVEEEMTTTLAISLVTEAIAASDLGSETQEALRFLLALVARQ